MKTKITLIALGLSISLAKAQAPYWKLNGNPNGGPDVVTTANNFFGTNGTNNIPIRFGTDGANRMKLNHTVSYPVNSSSPASVRDGFLLLGSANSNLASGGTLYSTKCAFSLLYLTLI